MSLTTIGASPMDGSSIMISFGADIRARPMASICRSPPLRVRATWSLRALQDREPFVHALEVAR